MLKTATKMPLTKYALLKDTVHLLELFENTPHVYTKDIDGFKKWIIATAPKSTPQVDVAWEGKAEGRSPESVISTLLVHMGRYAKNYSKSAMFGSDFSTQDEFIYLITLKSFGTMAKMDLIKRNKHDKPSGMQIINRLIANGWVEQRDNERDKRSKMLSITTKGLVTLEQQMHRIRQASKMVSGNLAPNEKLELIRLLDKLDQFHHPIYLKNYSHPELLDEVEAEFFALPNN